MNTAELIKHYEQGNSLAETAKRYKTSNYTVKKILKDNNIRVRTREEQLVLENKKRAKKINHNYFSSLTLENSYYLGFLAADGTVRKKKNEIKLGLSAVDKEFLIEFRNKLQSEHKISEYETSNGFQCVSLTFTSVLIKNELAKYSIIPNKTYIGVTMRNIPDKFKLAFIKGYFDGDGSFSFNKNTKQCAIKIASYKKGILEEINEYFGCSGKIYKVRENLYSLEFSTVPAEKIMKKFYKLDTPCLQRKKNKFDSYLELRK